jgi:recombinational DNA repair protein (RecF pathway)
VLEFLERAAYGEGEDSELMELAASTLAAMAEAPLDVLEAMLRAFEVQACRRLGYAPELTAKRRLPPIMKLLSGLESNRLPMTGLSRRDATL